MAKVVGVLHSADRSRIAVLTEGGRNVEVCIRSLAEDDRDGLSKKARRWIGNRVSYEYGASGVSLRLLGDAYITEQCRRQCSRGVEDEHTWLILDFKEGEERR